MGRYIARRLLLTIPVLIGSSFLIYALVFLLPGDPIRALFGDRPPPPAVLAELNERYHLNENLFVQYGYYVADLLRGDFGTDFQGRPVSGYVSDRLPVTARLTAIAIAFEATIGLLAGILAGIRRGSFFDSLVLVSTTVVISIPVFVLGFLAQYTLGLRLEWFPISGLTDGYQSYLLPGFVLGSLSLAYVARLTRTSLAENLRNDYVRTAKAKGLSPSVIIGKHTLRNSMIAVVTFIGADIGSLMGGAILTETVFNIPGLGLAVFDAVQAQEGTLVVGIATLLVFFYIFANLIVDVLYAALDPRIRYD